MTDLPDIIITKTIQVIQEKAHNDGLAPICIAVFDRNGLQSFFIRMENAVKLAIPLASEKAKTSALMGISTRQMHKRLTTESLTLADFCGSASTSLIGGMPILYEGKVIGGVGVSGRKPEEDEKIATFFCEEFIKILDREERIITKNYKEL